MGAVDTALVLDKSKRNAMSSQSGNGSQQNTAMSTLTQKNARTVSELERIPYLPQVYAIPIEQRKRESQLLEDAVEFQPKLY